MTGYLERLIKRNIEDIRQYESSITRLKRINRNYLASLRLEYKDKGLKYPELCPVCWQMVDSAYVAAASSLDLDRRYVEHDQDGNWCPQSGRITENF